MRSTNNRIQDYQNFFMDQAREAESERLAFMHTPMSQLFRAGEITIGTVEHLDDESGHMIIQFPRTRLPALGFSSPVWRLSARRSVVWEMTQARGPVRLSISPKTFNTVLKSRTSFR